MPPLYRTHPVQAYLSQDDERYRRSLAQVKESRQRKIDTYLGRRDAQRVSREEKRRLAQQRQDAIDQENRQFGRQRELATMEYGFERGLLGDRYGYAEQAADTAAGRQATRDQAIFGRERTLLQDRYGYDTLGREQSAEIAKGAAEDQYQYGRMSMADQAAYAAQEQQRGAEIARMAAEVGHQYDVMDNREKALVDRQARQEGYAHGKDMMLDQFQLQQQSADLTAGRQAGRDQMLFEQQQVGADLTAERQLERDMIQQGYQDQNRMADFGLDTMEAELQADMAIQEGIRNRDLFLPKRTQDKIDLLDAELAEVWANDQISVNDRENAWMQLKRKQMALRAGAQDTPRDKQPPTLQEQLQEKIHNFDMYSDLPWMVDQDGDPMLPRGYSPPDPVDPAEQEQKIKKAELDDWRDEMGDWYKDDSARKAFAKELRERSKGDDVAGNPVREFSDPQIKQMLIDEYDVQLEKPVPPYYQAPSGRSQGVPPGPAPMPAPPPEQPPEQPLPPALPEGPGFLERAGNIPDAMRKAISASSRASWSPATQAQARGEQAAVAQQEAQAATAERQQQQRAQWMENVPRPQSKAEYDALPSGTIYMYLDGTLKRKP